MIATSSVRPNAYAMRARSLCAAREKMGSTALITTTGTATATSTTRNEIANRPVCRSVARTDMSRITKRK